jgi:extradiol dioxygenase family protein
MRRIFHLSISVSDLSAAKHFYVNVLGAVSGRETRDWLDVLLWGHQITLQLRPADVLPLEKQGKRHFGVVLPWEEWESEAGRIKAAGAILLEEPVVLLQGTAEEQGKFYLNDPSNNLIEVKAYRDVKGTLGLEQDPALD